MRSGRTRATGSTSSNASTRHQLYYQGPLSTTAERAPVEPAAQRLSGHRAVGRMGLVGRYRIVVEDARGADRRRPQLLAEHRAVLGLGHRRLLSEQRADRASSTRAGSSSRPSAGRSARTAARGGLRLPWGWGWREMGPREYDNTQHADPAGRSAQHPAVGAEQPRDRAGARSGTPSCATSSCRTPTRWRARRATPACR